MCYLTEKLRKFIADTMRQDRTFIITKNGKDYIYNYYFDKDYRVIARYVRIVISGQDRFIPGVWKIYMMPEDKKSTYKVE